MEKVAGVTLDRVWDSMKIEDRAGLVKAVASYQKSWMSVSFEQLGSIYYARDLDEQVSGPLYTDGEGTRISNPKFAVGPTTGRNFNDDGRETIEFDRGPWSTVEDYHLAAGYRDIYCVKNIARLPKSPLELWGPGTYQPTREKKLKALQYYIGMIKYLLPVDQSIRSSCLWHEDLHHENILVNPQNPTEVISILDWQSTEVASLFSHARQPPFLNHDGPPMVGLERPRLPENFAQLDPAARKEARRIYIDSTTSTYYKTLLHIQNPRLYNAMVFQESVSFTVLSVVPRQLLLHGEAVYLTQTVELEKEWNELPGVIAHGNAPFPFNFSSEEKADFEADCEREHRSMCLVKDVQASMGDLYPDGWIVSEEKYDETKDALRQMKEQVIATYAHNESEVAIWEEHWPYDD
ncbi:MAG: hypothetical protein M1812_007688 [Candelaria pacifica]|nr:MAG: hypothetical protein M1812_007688 [Candelaria pacifica]